MLPNNVDPDQPHHVASVCLDPYTGFQDRMG